MSSNTFCSSSARFWLLPATLQCADQMTPLRTPQHDDYSSKCCYQYLLKPQNQANAFVAPSCNSAENIRNKSRRRLKLHCDRNAKLWTWIQRKKKLHSFEDSIKTKAIASTLDFSLDVSLSCTRMIRNVSIQIFVYT